MRKIIFIVEECHGTIGAASNFEKAKLFLLESGWVDEGFDYYAPGADSSIPIKEAFGENWQEEFMKLEEDDFDGQFYFYEKDFLE
jgi:hypothetical protein